jgi:hypothetical protein
MAGTMEGTKADLLLAFIYFEILFSYRRINTIVEFVK